MIKLGEKIREDEKEARVCRGGFWERRRARNKFKSEIKIYQNALSFLEEDVEIFKEELNI